MTITRVTAGSQASIDDLNQLIELLEGTSGYELAFLLRCIASSDFTIRLADAAGAREFIIQDSGGNSVATIDSDGNMALSGTFNPGVLIAPVTTSPSQTTEGSIAWDSDDDRLTAGTGAATKVIGLSRGAGSDASATQELMYDTTASRMKVWDGTNSRDITPVTKYKAAGQTFTGDTTFADITASSGTFAFDVVANGVYVARYVLPLGIGGTGGVKLQLTGPAAPTAVWIDINGNAMWVAQTTDGDNSGTEVSVNAAGKVGAANAFSNSVGMNSSVAAPSSGTSGTNLLTSACTVTMEALVVNGSTAGTVTLQGAQNSSNSTTEFQIGSRMIVERIA
jgi:hypothetical protein